MIPKSGYRFSEKIMLRQNARAGWRLEEKSSRSSRSNVHSGVAPDFSGREKSGKH
jgi:hypothetical protein